MLFAIEPVSTDRGKFATASSMRERYQHYKGVLESLKGIERPLRGGEQKLNSLSMVMVHLSPSEDLSLFCSRFCRARLKFEI